MFLGHLTSPMRALLLVTNAEQSVRALDFADHKAHVSRTARTLGEVELEDRPAPADIADALRQYFQRGVGALDGVRTPREPRCNAGFGRRYQRLRRERQHPMESWPGSCGSRICAQHRHGDRQWCQSDRDHCAVPQGHCQQWRLKGLCLGCPLQALAAGARKGHGAKEETLQRSQPPGSRHRGTPDGHGNPHDFGGLFMNGSETVPDTRHIGLLRSAR